MFSRYSSQFWIICLALLFFMISFNLILPEMNEYIENLGGKNYKGLIIALFTISSALARPFSGKLSDTIGRKKVMHIGIIIGFVVSLIYPLCGMFTLLGLFLFLRFMHGFSAGFLPTGATAFVTDLLPENKRGVGMGIWGTFISLGIGIGQYLGSPIEDYLGIDSLFLLSALAAVLCTLLLTLLKETLPEKQTFSLKTFRIKKEDIFDSNVLPAAVVMLLSAVSSGIIFVIVPDMAEFLDIGNKGTFFGIYVLSTILIRLFASGLSDYIGRRKTLLIGMLLMAVSMSLIGLAKTPQTFTLGAILFGITTGISSPTLMAWTADLSLKERRGVGAGTLFIALEIGIFIGSISTMLLYDSTINTIPQICSIGFILSLFAVLYLTWHLKYRQSKT